MDKIDDYGSSVVGSTPTRGTNDVAMKKGL